MGAAFSAQLLDHVDLVLSNLIYDDRRSGEWFSREMDAGERLASPGHLTILSVLLLCETLTNAWHLIYEKNADLHRRPACAHVFPTVLRGLMARAGWCPGEIESPDINADINSSSAYLLAMMDRTVLEKDHTSCDIARCTAYDVDYDSYKTKHTTLGCLCRQLPMLTESINTCISWILDDGGMPLIWLSDLGSDEEALVNVTYCSIVRNYLYSAPRLTLVCMG